MSWIPGGSGLLSGGYCMEGELKKEWGRAGVMESSRGESVKSFI